MDNIKYENEITVEINTSYNNLKELLESKGFKLSEEYDLIDIYMMKKDCDNTIPLEMLKNCVLVRNIITETKNLKYILYKYKEYNNQQEIVKQGKVKCQIESLEDAQSLLEVMGYKNLIKIVDHIKVFSKNNLEFAVQLVNDKHIYLELEDDGQFGSIDKMKNVLIDLDLPIKDNNFFVKKAEIEILESYQ